ncbi:hypothetical protein [Actinomadura sp. 6K520]|jgi:hypothetical protein|uniref:hypothetical protein n=1 Tax=Actinomadura sp. 6K520 TaxID=2530364 RepID=UPI001A9CC01A|nr:hypothetical protein [Actinomadura sp. 6K520]
MAVLLRLAYLTVANTFAALRLLPMTDRDKDAEILVPRHPITVLERQLEATRVQFTAPDWALLAALLHPLRRGGTSADTAPGTARHGAALAP